MATAESLVERGSFSIDDSPGLATVDKVYIEGRFYGCQTPLLPMIMALFYFPLFKLGISFAQHRELAVWFLTWIFTGGSIAGTAALLGQAHFLEWKQGRKAVGFALLFFFGALYISYSSVLSSHIFSGFLIFLSSFLVIYRHGSKLFLFIAGLAVSTAAMTDPPAGFAFGAALLLYLLIVNRSRFGALFYILGAVPPAAAHALANIAICGSIVPVNVQPEYFQYPGAIFDASNLSGVVANTTLSQLAVYGFHSLIGHRGWFSYTPLLLFSLWGFIVAVRNSGNRGRGILLLASLAVVTAFYLWRTQNYGDCAYGNRFFLAITPVMFSGMIFLGKRLERKVVRGLFKAAIVWSVFVAFVGMMRPISDARLGLNTFATNLYYLQTIVCPGISHWSWKGLVWLSGGDYKVAETAGRWLFDLGQYSSAEMALNYALEYEKLPLAEKTRGEMLLNRGEYIEALSKFETAMKWGEDPDLLYLTGRAFAQMKEPVSSSLFLGKYISRLDSEIAAAPPQLAKQGLVYYDEISDRDKALAIMAGNMLFLNELDSAKILLKGVSVRGESLAEVLTVKGRYYALTGEGDSAAVYVRRVLDKYPRMRLELIDDPILNQYIDLP